MSTILNIIGANASNFQPSKRGEPLSPNVSLENSGNGDTPTSARDNDINVDIEGLVGRPLNERELRLAQNNFETLYPGYSAGRRYDIEADIEERSDMDTDPGLNDPKIRDMLKGQAGAQRRKVAIRNKIKKRWERLGVWNPEWGIPGRVNEGPRDKTSSWKWRWQGDTPACGAESWPYISHHPNSHAVHLREGLRRGERDPRLPPRCSLAPDASKSVAESFITSRPWYTFEMDLAEEKVRLDRVPLYRRESLFNENFESIVLERWTKKGWLPNEKNPRHAWKWDHEALSPEPEDPRKIEFTPSEIDALEAIPPPTPPPQYSSQPRVIKWLMVPGPDRQMITKIARSPEAEHALGAKPTGCIFGVEPEAIAIKAEPEEIAIKAEPEEIAIKGEPEEIAPAAEMAKFREELRPSPPQPKAKGQPRGPKIKLILGGAKALPRRSDRIAKRSRQLEVAGMRTNPTKATRSRKGVPHAPKTVVAISTVGPGSRRGRGGAKAMPSKASKPRAYC